MVGTVDFRTILTTPSVIIKHFYFITLEKLSVEVAFLSFFKQEALYSIFTVQ